jgi:hypothetical protein
MTAKELEADEGGYVYRYRYMGSEGRTAVSQAGYATREPTQNAMLRCWRKHPKCIQSTQKYII